MKKNMKIFKLIALFTLFSALYSCHNDDASISQIQNNLDTGLTTKKVTLSQVLAKVNNQKIREKVINENTKFTQNLTNINNSYNRMVIPDSIYTMIEYNDNTSFLLPLNSYSIENPYFLKLAINIDQNQQESFGILKYIPTSPTTSLDLKTFTGIMQVLDIDEEVRAMATFVDGIPTNTNQPNANARMICYDMVVVTAVNCGLRGNHAPGVACNDGVVRGHYSITTQTICNFVPSTPFLTQVIEDSNYDGTSSVNVGMALADNFANTQLTPEQKLIYDLNPSIREYLANNVIIVPHPNYNPVLGGEPNMAIIKPEAEQFVLELIDFYNDENIIGEDDLKDKIRQAIANGITSTAEFTHKIFKKFSNLAEEYPSSITYINSVLETINDAAAIVTNTNPSTCTFADLFNMWLFELGPNPININGQNSTSTNQLKIQEGVNQARNIALSKIQNGDFSNTNHSWTYGQGEFYDGMANGNFVTAFLGSYSVKITISSTPNGYQLNYQVSNTSSWDSATRFRIDNDGNGVHDGVFPNTYRNNNNDLSSGGNFTQNWNWSETH